MDFMKVFVELKLLSTQTKVALANHLSEFFDPDTSEQYRFVLDNFHLKDLEATEYRSAYRQFCDWMYGWKASDGGNSLSLETTAELAKFLRPIDFSSDLERAEIERLIHLLETLFIMTRRTLTRKFIDAEQSVPSVGQGLRTMKSTVEFEVKDGKQASIVASTRGSKEITTLPPIAEAEESASLPEKTRKPLFKQSNPELNKNLGHSTTNTVSAGKNHFNSESDLQRDIDQVFIEIDRTIDYSLLYLAICYVIMSLAEISLKQGLYTRYLNQAQELFSDVISYGLSTLWTALQRDTSLDLSLSDFRDLPTLGEKLQVCYPSTKDRTVVNGLPLKLSMLNTLFLAMDIHLFPNAVCAHSLGSPVKGLRCSMLDENLWLSGGYDCMVRIHDIRPPYTCYAQYVGHASIVTDVNFAKGDLTIISASFDRTLRIWNAATAQCERVLSGHDDAITSCDITPDGRYAISGSLDNTVRVWDCNTGVQLNTIRKHTKWIKTVRFTSEGGRYFVTASLDSKIYIWETKVAASGKPLAPAKVIDSHLDAIIDIALYKHQFILSASRDRTVKLFDFVSGKELHTTQLGSSRWGSALAFSYTGQQYAVGTSDQAVLIFNTADGTKLRHIRLFNLGVVSVRFPPQETPHYVAVGTSDGFIQQVLL